MKDPTIGYDVNNIAECNLLNDITNPTKCEKNKISHFYPIIYECMSTSRGEAKFKNLWILLDSGFSSTDIIRKIASKLKQKIDNNKQWQTQAGDFTSNEKVKINFGSPEFSATKIMMR